MIEKFAALREAKQKDKYLPECFYGADRPKCPHCGHEHDISESGWWHLYEEGEHEVTCELCDEDFSVSTRVSYSFSTDRQEDEDV